MCVCARLHVHLPVHKHARMLLKPVYRPEEEELGAYLDPFLPVRRTLVTVNHSDPGEDCLLATLAIPEAQAILSQKAQAILSQ